MRRIRRELPVVRDRTGDFGKQAVDPVEQGLQLRWYVRGVQRVQAARVPASDFIGHSVEGPHAAAHSQPYEEAQERRGQKQRGE